MALTLIKSDPRAREKPCLRCGYSLRKLLDAKHCPECGLSVWLSLNGNDALDWSNPPWLRKLAVAAGILALAQLLGLIAWIFLSPQTRPRLFPALPVDLAIGLMALATGGYMVVYHAGLFLLGAAENRFPARLKSYRVWGMVVGIVAGLFGLFLIYRGFSRIRLGLTLFRDFSLARGTAAVLLGVSALITFGHLRKLAQRIPNSTMARLCGYLMLAPLVSLFKFFPFFGYFLVVELLWVINYLPWVYLPFTLILFVRFARDFWRASNSAAQSWAAESAPA